MGNPSSDPSVKHEPHLSPANAPPPPPAPSQPPGVLPYAKPDLNPEDLNRSVWREPHLSGMIHPDSAEDRAKQGIWEEPALTAGPMPAPDVHSPTYARWLAGKRSDTPASWTWLLTLAIALAAGPWAIFGAICASGQSAFGVLMLIFVGPVTEEIMKLALPAVFVEKWPYLFRSRFQIIFCGVLSGLAFAVIENLIYLNLYIPNAGQGLTIWRWTVCVALHSCCSCIAAIGVARVWHDCITRGAMPRPSLGAPWMTAAIVVHGAYNAFALILEWSGYDF